MKKLLFITIASLTVLFTCAQTPQKVNTWYEYQRFGVDSLLWIPGDTVKVPAAFSNYPYIAWKNNAMYIWSNAGHKWTKGSSTFDSSLANSNVKLTANRKINGNNKTFTIDSTSSILLQNGIYGPRLTMVNGPLFGGYGELGFFDTLGTAEVIVGRGSIQLFSDNQIAFNSVTGYYGFSNLPNVSFSNEYNIMLSSTVDGSVSQTPASELFKNVIFGGAVTFKRTVVTSNTTLNDTHYYVAVDASSAPGTVTITLPPVATCPGRVYMIKKIDSGSKSVAVAYNGTENIEGLGTIYLGMQWNSLTVIAGDTGWEIINLNN